MSEPKRTIYAINASGGARVSIPLTVNGCPYVEIVECPPDKDNYTGSNFAPQGLIMTLPDDSFTDQIGVNPAAIISFGNSNAMGRPGGGKGLGFQSRPSPGAANISGTTYCNLVSATAVATQVQVSEWHS
jgi:hypothetical protein